MTEEASEVVVQEETRETPERVAHRRERLQRAILGKPREGESELDTKLLKQLEDARKAHFRCSVVDPPFASLGEKFAEMLDGPMKRFQEEVEFLQSSYEEWTQHIADYGFDRPERLLALAVVAAIKPELEAFRARGATDLTEWILGIEVAARILDRVACYATCAFVDYRFTGQRSSDFQDAVERAFLRAVMLEIHSEIADMYNQGEL